MDLIVSLSAEGRARLHLFARRTDEVAKWLDSVELSGRHPVDEFSEFAKQEFDAVINFVGVGNPARMVAMGNTIFDVTLHYDNMVLEYLQMHPACRYLFLSSGAAYGNNFNVPARQETPAVVAINNLAPHEWYGVAKLHAECRHRAHSEYKIIDIRVFNYFSDTQDINARFLIADILRAIRDKTVLRTSSEYMVRDYLHQSDFFQMVKVLLDAPPINTAVDCYSRAPVDKPTLLAAMQEAFGLQYVADEENVSVNATGGKSHYYSLNTIAANYGYRPAFTSLDAVIGNSKIILGKSLRACV
ncbi:MAG: NAD-dependent epimerase/dehydratase family protein [Methylomicrobium sp.]|nr:NAD-dependent epimerase/dehydratase family protein [Methylomicrobium sp.]